MKVVLSSSEVSRWAQARGQYQRWRVTELVSTGDYSLISVPEFEEPASVSLN